MILVLTYHKVCGTPAGAEPNFYTVTGAQLDRHIHLLHEKGYACMRIEDLISAATVPDPRYILTFDDGTIDHYEVVFPLLEEYHCQGVFFIPTAKLNQPGYLTNAQVKEIAAAGHAIGLHGHEHRRLDVMSDDEVRRQLALSQKIIADLTGATPVLFVPPGGFVNDRIRAIGTELGVRVMRTMRWGYNQRLDLMALETIPINRYMNDRKFLERLESRNKPVLYAAKEALKRLIPLPAYEWVRRTVFKFSKPD
jgi:peptidoglycan/xylan/chitin deacetylase (PgdA/CDA1 family)